MNQDTQTFYGKYRGIVVDVNDPEKRGRIRVECPRVLGEQVSGWALPCFPIGIIIPPKKDDLVWIEFEEGDKNFPIWTGLFYTTAQFNSVMAPYSSKNTIIYDACGNKMTLNSDGTIVITAKTSVTLIPAPYYTKGECDTNYYTKTECDAKYAVK